MKKTKMINDFSILSLEVTYFLLVFEQKSINGAARKINQDAGNISRHLARFEKATGKSLFTRHQTGLRPTPFAEKLYEALSGAKAEFAEIMLSTDKNKKKIRIGFSPSVGYTHFARCFLKTLLESKLDAEFIVENSITLIEMAKKRDLDFALVPSAVKFPGLISKLVASESLVLCSASKDFQEILVTSAEMLGLERVLPIISYKQRWTLNDYFVVAKFLETDTRLMGILPESICTSHPKLNILERFPKEAKITALSWPLSEGTHLLRALRE